MTDALIRAWLRTQINAGVSISDADLKVCNTITMGRKLTLKAAARAAELVATLTDEQIVIAFRINGDAL